jgi:hypothetical protein
MYIVGVFKNIQRKVVNRKKQKIKPVIGMGNLPLYLQMTALVIYCVIN